MQYNFGTFLNKPAGHVLTDSRRAAGDEDDLVV
jgi:hypothetical protein